MKKWLAIIALVLAPFRLTADDSLLRFDGGIGVDPLLGISAGAPVMNIVRGVPPAGAPWVIRKLHADVRIDGRITIEGRGLLLSGGNGIGTSAGARVLATLFCGTPGSATPHSTSPTGVVLDANGDFRIDDVLSPPTPVPCASPVLLIVTNPTAPRWFAAGIVKHDDDREDDRDR
jgi:hypothetical protein